MAYESVGTRFSTDSGFSTAKKMPPIFPLNEDDPHPVGNSLTSL